MASHVGQMELNYEEPVIIHRILNCAAATSTTTVTSFAMTSTTTFTGPARNAYGSH